ncbi:phage antirepressor [Lactococcus lactis]|uniref:phage antirepressor n=1 Tax=Lactococcus lactis TaxID=1358 RepID=UPI000729ADCB|nr:phage antirepressor KilAC domain-containing protein [Lactococcus lactis]KST82644.1 Phage antirepressor protein [Lactococcus lactis subsp. lactis]
MNELQNIDGFNAKIYGTAENPLFLAKDIAELIEHSRASEMLKTVDDDEKLMQPILASGQNRNMWFLTEDGLYEVLMSSKKPQAKVFKKKVKEILKTIRKHGAYMTNEVIEKTLTSPDFIIQLATKLKDEQEARLELEKENSQLSLDLAEATEKTRYLDLILDSPDELIVKQIAQDYGISAVKFNQILNKLRIQYKQNNQWILYSKFQGKGYIKSRTFNYIGSDKK